MEMFVNARSAQYFSSLNDYPNVRERQWYLVSAEYNASGHDSDSDFAGLDVALGLPAEAPLLLCSFMPESYFVGKVNLSTKFFAIMARKKVGFIDAFDALDNFYKKLVELDGGDKQEDLLAIITEKEERGKEVLMRIKHSFFNPSVGSSAQINAQIHAAIDAARAAGFQGTDQEILEIIKDFNCVYHPGRFAGHSFPGVFCDLEGTLLLGSKVNLSLLEELKRLSLVKPITLWTAGDVDEYRRKLIAKGIFWKIVSKRDFIGAEVEIAFDDCRDLNKEFGITAKTFNPVFGRRQILDMQLNFLHLLLVPTGIPSALNANRFAEILNRTIGSKTIAEYLQGMKTLEGREYNQALILLRDCLLN